MFCYNEVDSLRHIYRLILQAATNDTTDFALSR